MIDFGLNAGEIDNNSDIRESYRVVITTPWPVCKLPNIKLACIHEKPFNRTGSIKKESRDSFYYGQVPFGSSAHENIRGTDIQPNLRFRNDPNVFLDNETFEYGVVTTTPVLFWSNLSLYSMKSAPL